MTNPYHMNPLLLALQFLKRKLINNKSLDPNMNVPKFIKSFKCPHCNHLPDLLTEEHVTATRFNCPCAKTEFIIYAKSDMLIVNYSNDLQVQIAADKNESLFRVMDTSGDIVIPIIDHHNFIPPFYNKSVEATIVFLETMVTFQ